MTARQWVGGGSAEPHRLQGELEQPGVVFGAPSPFQSNVAFGISPVGQIPVFVTLVKAGRPGEQTHHEDRSPGSAIGRKAYR